MWPDWKWMCYRCIWWTLLLFNQKFELHRARNYHHARHSHHVKHYHHTFLCHWQSHWYCSQPTSWHDRWLLSKLWIFNGSQTSQFNHEWYILEFINYRNIDFEFLWLKTLFEWISICWNTSVPEIKILKLDNRKLLIEIRSCIYSMVTMPISKAMQFGSKCMDPPPMGDRWGDTI